MKAKPSYSVFSLLLSLIAIAGAANPNFVFVLADDHSAYDSTPYGSTQCQTPNMQALADGGIKFTNAYVASPACAPSRAALFTGLMPYRNGIVGNHETELKPGVTSLIPILIEQGYEVAFHGKVAHGPLAMHRAYVPKAVTIIERETKFDTKLASIGKFLKNRPDPAKPLALFIGTTDTHTPWQPLKSARIKPEDVVISPRIYETHKAQMEMARYIEAVENVDRKIGTVRKFVADFLDPANTMLAYTSDHGMPWPFAKWSLYETGIHTPLLITWPGTIKPGTVSDAMVSWIDIMPTLIDLAGGEVSEKIDGKSFAKVLSGEATSHRDAIFATHKGDKGMNVYPIRSVRVGDWKYIRNLHPEFMYTTHTDILGDTAAHGGQHWPSYIEAAKTDPEAAKFLIDYHSSPAEELYNLAEDPFEQTNLAESPEHAEKLSELSAMVTKRMAEVGDDESLSGEPRLLKDHPLPTIPSVVADEKEGWKPLFNGKDLSGFSVKSGKANFVVNGDSIVGTTAQSSPNSFLTTDEQYGDFELEFDVKVDDSLNSGVQIRSILKDLKKSKFGGRLFGPQVEIEASGTKGSEAGYIYGEATGRGWITPKDKLVPHKNMKDGEWNHYRIVAKGVNIKTWINGEMVSDLSDEGIFKTHPKGFIGFQVHGIKKGQGPFSVAFKNIRIKELD